MNIKNKIKTTGERSIEPKVGKKRLILFSAGSVNLLVVSSTEKTNRFCVFRILKATNQLEIALMIIIQI
jgi:hypothetical protein